MGKRLAMLCLGLLAFAQLCPDESIWADEARKSTPRSLNELSMEVAALHGIHLFKLTPVQMQKLKALSRQTGDDAGARSREKASAVFRQTLADLHKALVKADNQDRIDTLQEKLEELRDKENPGLDDGFDITDAARKRAPELLRSLSARQVAAYLAAFGDQFPDPHEQLMAALDKVRKLNAKEWQQQREALSEEVGRLAAGLDEEKAGQISEQAIQLLIQVRALREDEFKKQLPELEKSAREIVGNVGPLDVLRHAAERALAELLSNPRLASAIDARSKK